MEKSINSQILKYLEKHKLIHDRQYGFRQQRSTEDLFLFVTGTGPLNIEVNLRLLLLSLLNRCAWIGSFLFYRRLSFEMDGHSSNFHPINAGVPQGSVLASTLFLLHINDLLSF